MYLNLFRISKLEFRILFSHRTTPLLKCSDGPSLSRVRLGRIYVTFFSFLGPRIHSFLHPYHASGMPAAQARAGTAILSNPYTCPPTSTSRTRAKTARPPTQRQAL